MRRRASGASELRAAYTEHVRMLASILGAIEGNAFAEELAVLEAGGPVVVPGWALDGYPNSGTFLLLSSGKVETVTRSSPG